MKYFSERIRIYYTKNGKQIFKNKIVLPILIFILLVRQLLSL